MEDQIHIKSISITDPAKKAKGSLFKKAKKITEDKIFEGGRTDKNILAPNKKNKDITTIKKW